MSTALTLVIVLLVLLLMLLAVALLMYYLTQQDLRNISARLDSLDVGKPMPTRSPDAVRRERSAAFDKLLMIEAGFASQPREALEPQELATFDECRQAIVRCNDELKQLKDWMGLPYDLEWVQLKERIPRFDVLYRQMVETTENGQLSAS